MRNARTFCLLLFAVAGGAALAGAEEVKIEVLATTDQHGNLMGYDYYTARPAARGLVKVATLIRQARGENPNNLLIDCGDTTQGTPLEGLHQEYVLSGALPLNLTFVGAPLDQDPMMLAMNQLGYDAMVVGNHEFNFGLRNLDKARSEARFPWISANIHTAEGSSLKPFAPYIVKNVAGVKVAVIGMTTPAIPQWETEEHYRGYRFESGVDAVRRTIDQLRAGHLADVIIVAAHSGLDRDLQSDASALIGDPKENMIYEIATQVPGVDAIIFGHTHLELPSASVNGVQLLQPKNWDISLGRMDFMLQRPAGGAWKITSKSSRVIPVTRTTPDDDEILRIAKPYHELTERYLNTPITQAPVALDARLSRSEDTAIIDAVQQVELFYSKADVSFASSFNPRVTVAKGPVSIRQLVAIYVYDNELWALEGNGKMVREALENSARYFQTCAGDCSGQPLINPRVIGYNYDMAKGVEYEIDLTRPPGDRIRNLRWHGQPLSDSQPLRIALNNYRAGGSAGYKMFSGAKVVWKSSEDVRDLMIRYYRDHPLPEQADQNWRIVPEAARNAVRSLALADSQPQTLR